MTISRERRQQIRIEALKVAWRSLDAALTYDCVIDFGETPEENDLLREHLDKLTQRIFNQMRDAEDRLDAAER